MINDKLSNISEIIQHRRSIYPAIYTGEIVPHEVIQKMLENANWAPTHRLTEPWRFTVFSGNGLLKLSDFQSGLYKKVSSEKGTFDQQQFEKLKDKPLLCSHIIAIGMKRDLKESVPEIEEIAAVSCAVQNMLLTASEAGVGCYWGSGGVTYYEEAKPFFNLEKNDKLLGFLFLGIPKKWPEGKRKPIGDKVNFIQ